MYLCHNSCNNICYDVMNYKNKIKKLLPGIYSHEIIIKNKKSVLKNLVIIIDIHEVKKEYEEHINSCNYRKQLGWSIIPYEEHINGNIYIEDDIIINNFLDYIEDTIRGMYVLMSYNIDTNIMYCEDRVNMKLNKYINDIKIKNIKIQNIKINYDTIEIPMSIFNNHNFNNNNGFPLFQFNTINLQIYEINYKNVFIKYDEYRLIDKHYTISKLYYNFFEMIMVDIENIDININICKNKLLIIEVPIINRIVDYIYNELTKLDCTLLTQRGNYIIVKFATSKYNFKLFDNNNIPHEEIILYTEKTKKRYF